MLATVTGREEYWQTYDKLWEYSWKVFVDPQMDFFNTERCVDPNGGFYHFFAEVILAVLLLNIVCILLHLYPRKRVLLQYVCYLHNCIN